MLQVFDTFEVSLCSIESVCDDGVPKIFYSISEQVTIFSASNTCLQRRVLPRNAHYYQAVDHCFKKNNDIIQAPQTKLSYIFIYLLTGHQLRLPWKFECEFKSSKVNL